MSAGSIVEFSGPKNKPLRFAVLNGFIPFGQGVTKKGFLLFIGTGSTAKRGIISKRYTTKSHELTFGDRSGHWFVYVFVKGTIVSAVESERV